MRQSQSQKNRIVFIRDFSTCGLDVSTSTPTVHRLFFHFILHTSVYGMEVPKREKGIHHDTFLHF